MADVDDQHVGYEGEQPGNFLYIVQLKGLAIEANQIVNRILEHKCINPF